MHSIQIIKFGFSILLVLAFFSLFGYQSIEKLFKDDTLIVEDLVDFEFSSPPCIGIRGWKKKPSNGLTVESKDAISNIKLLEDLSSIQTTLDEYAIGLEKIVEAAKDAQNKNIPSSLWNSDMGPVTAGYVHFLNDSYAIGSENPLTFDLGSNNSLTLSIMDPNYFMFSANQMTFPRVEVIVPDLEEGIINVNIEAVYHNNMNKPSNPCNKDKGYSFTSCVRSATSRQAGCRHHLDKWSDPTILVCSTGQQLLNLTYVFNAMLRMDKTSVTNETKCLPPCSFTEYKLAGKVEREKIRGIKKVNIKLSDTKVKSLNEQKLYDIVTFIAEFGGALGLFVGFSFLSIFDYYEFALKFLPQFK